MVFKRHPTDASARPPQEQTLRHDAVRLETAPDFGSGLPGFALLLDLIEHTPAALAVVQGQDHRYILANPAYRAIAGAPVLGRTVREVFPWFQARDGVALLDEVYRSGQTITRRAIPLGTDDSERFWDFDHVPLRGDSDEVAAILITASEVTEKVRADRAVEGLAAAAEQSARRAEAAERRLQRHTLETVLPRDRPLVQDVLDSLFAFAGVLTPEGILIEANRTALQAAALRPEDVLGKPFDQTYWWAHAPEVQARLREAIARAAQGEAVRYDAVVRLAEDRFITIDFMLAPVRDVAGRVTYLIPSGIDVTDRKHTEEALRDSQARLQLLVEQMPAVLWSVDPELRFTSLLGAGLKDLGLRPNQIVGMSLFTFFRTDNADFEPIAAVRRALRGETCRYEVEWHGLVYESHVEPLYDAGGAIIGAIGVALDTTRRRRAEIALRQSEERLRSMIEANPIGVIRGDIHGSVLEANDAFLKIVGYSREDLKSGRLRWTDITPAEDLPLDARHIAEARANGVCTPYEKAYIRKDGTLVPVLVGFTLLGEEREESVAFILDLTERKQAEQALKATLEEKDALLQQKEMLLREVNHRIRNSLQLVSSMLMLQSRTIADPVARGQFVEAHNRVLTVAKVHERLYQQTKTPDRIEFGQYLRELCTHLVSTALADREQVQVVVEADHADMLTDQAVPLALIVNELLTNAFKYAFRDGVGGTVTVAFRVAADGRRSLVIQDDGCGLPDGFAPAKSTGLGMRLLTALVAQLGARLEVGRAGRGARFVIDLPNRVA